MIDPFEAQRVARRVGDVFDDIGIPWVIVGSMASSVHGMPRSTHDIDIAAVVDVFDTDALVVRLATMGYVDREAVLDAAERGRSFNFIDDATSDKVDVFCLSALSGAPQIARARAITIGGVSLPYASAEDTVAQKLRWFDRGGRTSERQWRDLVEVIQVQGPAIDNALLAALAAELGVGELLVDALIAAAAPRH